MNKKPNMNPMRQKSAAAQQRMKQMEKMKQGKPASRTKKMDSAVAKAKKSVPYARPKPAAGRKPKQRLS